MMSASGGILSTIGNGSASVKSLAGEMDFKALAMESESLLSHIARPDGIPRLTKSLAEIVSDRCSSKFKFEHSL